MSSQPDNERTVHTQGTIHSPNKDVFDSDAFSGISLVWDLDDYKVGLVDSENESGLIVELGSAFYKLKRSVYNGARKTTNLANRIVTIAKQKLKEIKKTGERIIKSVVNVISRHGSIVGLYVDELAILSNNAINIIIKKNDFSAKENEWTKEHINYILDLPKSQRYDRLCELIDSFDDNVKINFIEYLCESLTEDDLESLLFMIQQKKESSDMDFESTQSIISELNVTTDAKEEIEA